MNTELEYLIKKFLDGEASGKEERTLKQLLEETADDEYPEVKAYFGFTHNEKQKDEIPFDFREFTYGVVDNGVSLNKKRKLNRLLRIAAVGVIFLVSGWILKLSMDTKTIRSEYSKEELREGLLNTGKALALFTENLNTSIVTVKNAGQISKEISEFKKINNIELPN